MIIMRDIDYEFIRNFSVGSLLDYPKRLGSLLLGGDRKIIQKQIRRNKSLIKKNEKLYKESLRPTSNLDSKEIKRALDFEKGREPHLQQDLIRENRKVWGARLGAGGIVGLGGYLLLGNNAPEKNYYE